MSQQRGGLGGLAPSAMAPIYELAGSIMDHKATKVENAFDSDTSGYQPPVASLPALRQLQPMTDGRDEADFDCQDMMEKELNKEQLRRLQYNVNHL
ncbi:hypothetical protein MRX96_006244 [Rhipicephalus microplus]